MKDVDACVFVRHMQKKIVEKHSKQSVNSCTYVVYYKENEENIIFNPKLNFFERFD